MICEESLFIVIIPSSCSLVALAKLILEREGDPSNLHFTFHPPKSVIKLVYT